MTKDEAKQFMPLIQAFAEGKTIQHRIGIEHHWYNCTDLAFADPFDNYRIKPEPPKPREFWCYVGKQKHCVTAYTDQQLAQVYLDADQAEQTILVREVLP